MEKIRLTTWDVNPVNNGKKLPISTSLAGFQPSVVNHIIRQGQGPELCRLGFWFGRKVECFWIQLDSFVDSFWTQTGMQMNHNVVERAPKSNETKYALIKSLLSLEVHDIPKHRAFWTKCIHHLLPPCLILCTWHLALSQGWSSVHSWNNLCSFRVEGIKSEFRQMFLMIYPSWNLKLT